MSQFELLDDDTTILMINQDTFTVARLKELISKKLRKKLLNRPENKQKNIAENFRNDLSINEESVSISMKNIQLKFPTEGMDCQLLNLNTK
ncbi:MAG: KGK domain-containing protein [Cyanobacteriota bacterium]|nr:KGK domain-containing protein [Cyanobacteriota bacterium]